MKKTITLVIGGCRSGKSRHALNKANAVKGQKKFYIATCVPEDAEMEERVARHKKERKDIWHTIEAPIRLDRAILACSKHADVILVDCLTLWAANLLLEKKKETQVYDALETLKQALTLTACPVYLVSGEAGMGIVPENASARQFRDFLGFINQQMADLADEVIAVIAGLDIRLKPQKR